MTRERPGTFVGQKEATLSLEEHLSKIATSSSLSYEIVISQSHWTL